MKTTHLTLAAFALPLLSAFAAEKSALPPEARAIVQGFRATEAMELKTARSRIEPKRAEAIAALKRQMDRETRNGNLDAALAIREQIAALDVNATGTSATAEPQPLEDNTQSLEASLVTGRKFSILDSQGNDPQLELKADKTITVREGKKVFPGQAFWMKRWDVTPTRIVIFNGNKEELGYFPFNPARKASVFTTTHKSGYFNRAKVTLVE
jgi:hypothetical protein